MVALSEFISKVSFNTIDPQSSVRNRNIDEIAETRLPEHSEAIIEDIEPLLSMRKMSSFAVAAMIWKAVREMPDDQVFLNIGVYYGFTFFAGCRASKQKTSIAVADYSGWGGAEPFCVDSMDKEDLPNGFFFKEDFETFFKHHMPKFKEKIGVYFYDADHKTGPTVKALRMAEPFMAKNCVVFLDDINLSGVRKASDMYFDDRWKQLLHVRTIRNGHPTFWNGLSIWRKEK